MLLFFFVILPMLVVGGLCGAAELPDWLSIIFALLAIPVNVWIVLMCTYDEVKITK